MYSLCSAASFGEAADEGTAERCLTGATEMGGACVSSV